MMVITISHRALIHKAATTTTAPLLHVWPPHEATPTPSTGRGTEPRLRRVPVVRAMMMVSRPILSACFDSTPSSSSTSSCPAGEEGWLKGSEAVC